MLAQIAAGTQQNLMSLVGQSLEMTFQGMGPTGAQLVLPGGQVLVAQGGLPFAQGTQLMVQVISEAEGTLRLQIREAKPPASPAVLQPLLSGEAQPLLARMSEERPSQSLAPLAQMLRQVLESVKPQPQASPLATTLVEEAVADLPQGLVQPLRQALGLPAEQPLAQALEAWIGSPVSQAAPADAPRVENRQASALSAALEPLVKAFTLQMGLTSSVPAPQRDFLSTWFRGLLAEAAPAAAPALVTQSPDKAVTQPTATLPPLLIAGLPEAVASLPEKTAGFLRQALGIPPGQPLAQGLRQWMEATLPRAQAEPEILALVQRFETLLRQAPDFPKAQRAFTVAWFRELLVKSGAEGSSVRAATPETAKSAPAPLQIASGGREAVPQAGLSADSQTGAASRLPLEEPAFWHQWVRGTAEALADPRISPREAPFHALQARDGTAYFELPAPWLPQGSVQLWVESDAPEGGRPEDQTRRILLGLQLSQLGDARLGLELTGNNLNVRVWAEHPEILASQEEELVRELAETGHTVNLRILPLAPGSPTLRALVAGNSWQGLG